MSSVHILAPALSGLLALVAGCTEPNPLFISDGERTDGARHREGGSRSCRPGAFIACGNDPFLERCNAAGNGTVLVSCAPAHCDPLAGVCNQCDPSSSPSCIGNELLSCGKDGLLLRVLCPGECAAGTCLSCSKRAYFRDGDGDGFGNPISKVEACSAPTHYVSNDADCDDLDPSAHPGQTSYFDTPSQGARQFDYNCNNAVEQQAPQRADCRLVNGDCTGDGWQDEVPGCGVVGTWVTCSRRGSGQSSCGGTQSSGKAQRCH